MKRVALPIVAYVGVLCFAALLYVPPITQYLGVELIVSPLSELPLLFLAEFAILRARARASRSLERWFWSLFAFAFGLLMLIRVSSLIWDNGILAVDLTQDLLYIGFYLAISLALELRLVGSRGDDYRGVRAARMAATVVFTLGLLGYFVLIPGRMGTDTYLSWVPSLFLYVILDAFLLVRLAGLQHSSRRGAWRTTYRLLMITVGGWLVLDGAELAFWVGLFDQYPGSDTPLIAMAWEFVWFLPYLPIILAARVPDRGDGALRSDASGDSRLARLPALSTQPLFYAVVLPILHSTSHVVGITDPNLRDARELLVLAMLPVLAGLAFLHHRLLEADNERLESERQRVAERAHRAQQMEAVGRLAGGIAHDFNNLLQVIRGSNELVARAVADRADALRNSSEVARAVERAAQLTDRLLAVGRRKATLPHPIELNDVVLHTTSMIERLIGDDILFDVTIGIDTGCVNVDRGQLEQVILNLTVNARDAMPEGGSLNIETQRVSRGDDDETTAGEPKRGWAMIAVHDTGVGMDAETRAHVFEPFYTTKVEGKGTGLGLSMVYSFVTQAEGMVEVDSKPGFGTTIRVYLPSIDVASIEEGAADDPLSERAQTRELTPHQSDTMPTVLVVEDENAVRTVIRDLLADQGFEVLQASTGEEALRLMAQGATPDLVLTDVAMPGMRGSELVRRIHERSPDTKVVYMTGNAAELAEEGPTRGQVLEKPFTRDMLNQRISEALATSDS